MKAKWQQDVTMLQLYYSIAYHFTTLAHQHDMTSPGKFMPHLDGINDFLLHIYIKCFVLFKKINCFLKIALQEYESIHLRRTFRSHQFHNQMLLEL